MILNSQQAAGPTLATLTTAIQIHSTRLRVAWKRGTN